MVYLHVPGLAGLQLQNTRSAPYFGLMPGVGSNENFFGLKLGLGGLFFFAASFLQTELHVAQRIDEIYRALSKPIERRVRDCACGKLNVSSKQGNQPVCINRLLLTL